MLDTSHPFAMAALQTADPGFQPGQSHAKLLSLPRKPFPPTTSSLGTAMIIPFLDV
jgi:hypothetical protein